MATTYTSMIASLKQGEMIENMLRSVLIRMGFLPSAYAWRNPFKIMEYTTLLKGVDFKREDVVLDFGCGAGKQAILLARKVKKVIGIDVAEDQIARARVLAKVYGRHTDIEFHCVRLDMANLAEGEFDKVVSFCVLEHLPNYEEILGLLHRLLKENGILLLSVDSLETIEDAELLAQHAKEGQVVCRFKAAEIRATLSRLGFRNIQTTPLFQSAYAKKLFEEGIRNRFLRYPRFGKILSYIWLTITENFPLHPEKGIFLCIRAVKKGA